MTLRHAGRVDNREAVWRAALDLSRNDAVEDRADAAQCLAPFVGDDEVDSRLIELACDPENTYVTETTVAALVRRQDVPGWRLVAHAFAVEPDDHTKDHMTDAIRDTLVFHEEAETEGRAALEELARDEVPEVASGASDLIAWLDTGVFPQSPLEPEEREKPSSWRRLLGR